MDLIQHESLFVDGISECLEVLDRNMDNEEEEVFVYSLRGGVFKSLAELAHIVERTQATLTL